MGIWLRELAGWIILGLGLLAVYLIYSFLVNRWIIEAGILSMSTFLLLRTGTHLLKVATAARAAGKPVRPTAKTAGKARSMTASATPTGRPWATVVPGPKVK